MNKKVVISMISIILIALCGLAALYGQQMYRMLLRHLGGG
jgi:hypothetical protein